LHYFAGVHFHQQDFVAVLLSTLDITIFERSVQEQRCEEKNTQVKIMRQCRSEMIFDYVLT